MTITMTLEERLADLLHVINTCLDNMLHIPVNHTLIDFSQKWIEAGKKPKSLDTYPSNKNTLYLIVLAGITPTDSVFFDPEDYGEDEGTEQLNTMFKYNTTYTYGDLFVALYVATQQLWELISKQEEDETISLMREACLLTQSCYLLLRPDSLRKIMQVEDMDQIAAMTATWKTLFDALETEDEEDDDNDNDEIEEDQE